MEYCCLKTVLLKELEETNDTLTIDDYLNKELKLEKITNGKKYLVFPEETFEIKYTHLFNPLMDDKEKLGFPW